MKKRISCILIMLTLAISTIGSFAQIAFSDVNQIPSWAKNDVEKMAEKKIISGDLEEGSFKIKFRPADNVTYIESIQIIYNMLKSTNQINNTIGLKEKYNAVLVRNSIPQWAHEAVAYALEKNIIMTGDLQSFVRNNQSVSAKKQDVAIFLAKMLNRKPVALPTAIYKFADKEFIKSGAIQAVDLLAREGIVTGDGEKKFNPNSNINRAVMAVMCSKTYNLLSSQSNVTNPTNPTIPSNIEGTIDYVSKNMIIVKDTPYTLKSAYIKKDGRYIQVNELTNGDSVKLTFDRTGEVVSVQVLGYTNNPNQNINTPAEKEVIIDYISEDTKRIWVKNSNGEPEGYNLSGVIIKKNGRNISIKDLNKGDGIKLIRNKTGQLDTVEVDKGLTKWQGRIDGIANFGNYHVMTIRNKDNLVLKKELKIYDNTEIKFDDQNISISRLVDGENVEVKFIGDRAIKIEIESKEVVYDGILESSVLFKTYPMLSFKPNNNQIMELEIDDDATIRRDRRRADLDDLKKGDIATITVDHGKIVEILAASREERTRDEGVIKQIIIGSPTKITIVADNKQERTYEIDESVDVEIDDKDADIRDLDLHYEVRLILENGEVTDIYADKVSHKNTISGDIEKIYNDYRYIVIKYFDSSKDEYISKTVWVPEKTKIVSKDAKPLQIGNLEKRTTVIINGYYDDRKFVATNIIELD